MNYCSKCGEKIDNNNNFCPKCGKNLSTNDEEKNESNANKIVCSKCGSTNVQVQLVSQNKNTSCLGIIFYIFLAVTIVGIPIMIIILLLKGKKSITQKYYVCQNCGKTFVSKMNMSNSEIVAGILIVLIFVGLSLVVVPQYFKDKNYADFSEYQPIDIQLLHNDYLDNQISAKDKYSGNFYYFSGQIKEFKEFLTDKYVIFQYQSERDNNKIIELDAYFSESKELADVKIGDEITVYCKFNKRTSDDTFNITTYSFRSCRVNK